MNESIFLLDKDGRLTEMNESGYITEDHLQELLALYPKLISGSQINPAVPCKWLLISREFGVPDDLNASNRWSLDHLFLDHEGIPTLIEVKRSSDTRIRREVIGQVLDYAANAVSYWSIEEIQHRHEQKCKTINLDPEAEISAFLDGVMDIDTFWENTKTNLKAGKIRMLIVADSIPKETQRIIEFLNGQMSPAEILGVEIKQFINGNLKTLVPRVLGQTAIAEMTKGRATKTAGFWDESSFDRESVTKNGQQAATINQTLRKWAESKAEISYGKGTASGSMQIWFRSKNNGNLSFLVMYTYGTVEMQFQFMKEPYTSNTQKQIFIEKLNNIPGINIPLDKIGKRPSISYSLLATNDNLIKFISILDWYYLEIKPHL